MILFDHYAAYRVGDTLHMPLVADHVVWCRERGLSEKTIYQRCMVLGRLANFAGCPPKDATPEQVAAWRSALEVGPDAAASYISHVREFYKWASRAGRLAEDRAAGLVLPKTTARVPRPIGEDQLLAALAAAPRRVRLVLVLAGWAGLRAQEIAWLRRADVLDTASPPVIVVARHAAKGRRERIVPMSAFVLAELRSFGLPRSGWILERGDGRPGPNQPWTVSHLANDFLHELGIAETLHQLRHRFGTQAYQASRDLLVVAQLLGHANVRTTTGYTLYSAADARQAVDALPVPGPRRVSPAGRPPSSALSP